MGVAQEERSRSPVGATQGGHGDIEGITGARRASFPRRQAGKTASQEVLLRFENERFRENGAKETQGIEVGTS